MELFACCVSRSNDDESDELDFSPVRSITLQFPKNLGEDLDREWEIVRRSVEAAEFAKLLELRELLQDCDSHAACVTEPRSRQAQTLLRFLRARDGNAKKADVMFRDMLDWRISFQVDAKVKAWNAELEEGKSPLVKMFLRYGTDVDMCQDKYDVPVVLMRLGVGDPEGAVREAGAEACLVHSLARLERTHQQLRRAMFATGVVLVGQVQVIDVGDYGEYGTPNWGARMWSAVKLGPAMFKVFDSNYPETVRKVFIVRTGYIAKNMWSLVQPLARPRTRAKIRIFGQNASEWITELRDEIGSAGELQAFLRCDSKEAFASAIPRGGLVPVGAGSQDIGEENGERSLATGKASREVKVADAGSWSVSLSMRDLATLLALVVLLGLLAATYTSPDSGKTPVADDLVLAWQKPSR